MAQIYKALLLAAAMIGTSLLAMFEIIPAGYSQWAPLALLAVFPSVWMGKPTKCGAAK